MTDDYEVMYMNEFLCVFCGEKISEEEKVSSILLTTHWLNEDEQEDQQLFCDLECFSKPFIPFSSTFIFDSIDSIILFL